MDPEEIEKRRQEAIEAMHKDIQERVDAGVTPLTDALAEIKTRSDEIDKKMERMELMLSQKAVSGGEDLLASGEFSVSRLCESMISRNSNQSDWRRHAETEWEYLDQAFEQRAGDPATSPDAAGGVLVPEQIAYGMLVEPYQDYIPLLTLGVNQMPNLIGDTVEIPTVLNRVGAETPAEHAEYAEANDQELDMGAVTLSPHTAQAIMKPSRQFLKRAVGGNDLIAREIGKALPREMSLKGFAGDGAGGRPTGMKAVGGAQAVDFAGVGAYSPAIFEKLSQMEGLLGDIDALENPNDIVIAMHHKALRNIRGMKSENAAAGTASRDMPRANIWDAANNTLFGYKYATTGGGLLGGANTDMIMFNRSEVHLGTWGGIMIEASALAESAMRHRRVLISAWLEYDWGFTREETIVKANNFDCSGV
mgnify:CR=1 FL=1